MCFWSEGHESELAVVDTGLQLSCAVTIVFTKMSTALF